MRNQKKKLSSPDGDSVDEAWPGAETAGSNSFSSTPYKDKLDQRTSNPGQTPPPGGVKPLPMSPTEKSSFERMQSQLRAPGAMEKFLSFMGLGQK